MQEKALYTVVVADDEEELREALCRMVPWETLGFSLVGSAGNGLDALELVEQLEPDLLLTDIRMPFISGIELARQVREIRPSIHIAFLSGFDDFEYAKQAIQYNIISYMLKPVTMDGITAELRRIREKIDAQFRAFEAQTQLQAGRDTFLLSLLLDDAAEGPRSEALLREQAAQNGLQDFVGQSAFVVLVTRLSDAAGTVCTPPSMAGSVDMVAEKYLRHASFYSGGRVLTLLGGNPSDFEEYLHILADELVQTSERIMRCRCAVGVSAAAEGFAGLHAACREASEALSYAGLRQSSIRYYSDMRRSAPARTEAMTDLVARTESAFKSGSPAALDACLAAMFTPENIERCGKSGLELTALQLIAGISRILFTAAGGEALAELQSRGALPAFDLHCATAAELRACLTGFCTDAMNLLASQQKKGGDQLTQQALAAIDQHYMDETLSLVSLSGLLHVSPNYLSACIKKYTGDTFIDLLIRRRMEVARGLLLNTQRRILDIAQACGYTDQHYFSYCFKKYCGVSPNALRRQDAPRAGAEP